MPTTYFYGVKETSDPKVNFTNQEKQNSLGVKHSTPFISVKATHYKKRRKIKIRPVKTIGNIGLSYRNKL